MGAAIPAERRVRRVLLTAAAVVVAAAFTVACPGGTQQHEGPSPAPGEAGTDWTQPITFAIPVTNVDIAAPSLPFTVSVPRGLGVPTAIFRSSDAIPRDGRAIAFEYDTPSYGRVLVVERFPDVPPEDYDAANQQLVQSSSGSSHLEIVAIRGGAQALVVTDPAGGSAGIYWLEGTVEFWVTGQALTRDQILAIVEAL